MQVNLTNSYNLLLHVLTFIMLSAGLDKYCYCLLCYGLHCFTRMTEAYPVRSINRVYLCVPARAKTHTHTHTHTQRICMQASSLSPGHPYFVRGIGGALVTA